MILTVASGCDNVAWGGVDMQLVPPPAAEPGTPAEAAPPEEEVAPPPEVAQPLLLAGTRDDANATLVLVGELRDGAVVPAPATSIDTGVTEGSEWILLAEGVRVGRMTAETIGPAEGFCPATLAVSGTVEIVPSAAAVERFIALPATEVAGVSYEPFRVHENDYDQRVASLTFAQEAIPRLGADWPEGGVLPTRQDLQAFQPTGTGSPTLAGSYVYRDTPSVGDPANGAYALFILAERRGGQFRETFEWYSAADSLGKSVPRYFGHFDLDQDGRGEVILDVFGSERRWHAVLEQTNDGWTRSFVSPCGIGSPAR
ncbi:MAG: hypothetical protein ACKVXR_18195 [Planctomycetota bacterium]